MLDVATGSGDLPLAVARWARRRGRQVQIVGLDISPEVLAEARRVARREPIDLVVGDARSLPYPARSFDLVTCCLALHHFPPAEATRVLAELWRVARRAVVVVDLVRGYPAYVGTVLATRVLTRNRLTRHDGPLSVLRAYTPDELRALAGDAGLENIRLYRHLFFRQALTARRETGNDR